MNTISTVSTCSNNTNKLSPQELFNLLSCSLRCSNNTNKLSPQEPKVQVYVRKNRSNNTNKLSPQERLAKLYGCSAVQIIQINLVLKNERSQTLAPRQFK